MACSIVNLPGEMGSLLRGAAQAQAALEAQSDKQVSVGKERSFVGNAGGPIPRARPTAKQRRASLAFTGAMDEDEDLDAAIDLEDHQAGAGGKEYY